MASKHRVTVGEELRYDSDLQGLKNLSGTYAPIVDASGKALVRRGDLDISVLDYGAKGDGTTDDTAAIQSAVNAAVSGGLRLIFPPRTYKVTSPVVMGSVTLSRGWQIEGYGATLLQATDNTPILKFVKEGAHLWAIRGFNFAWSNNQASANTAAAAIYFDSDTNLNFGYYNFELANLRFQNGCRGVCLNEASAYTIPVWGADIHNIHHTSGMSGACVRLIQTASGQPNVRLAHVYVRGDAAGEILINLQGVNVLVMENIEFNQCAAQELLLTTCNAVDIRGIRSEQGTLTANFTGLWTFSDVRGRIAGIQVQSKTFTASSAGNWNYLIRAIGSSTTLVVGGASVSTITASVGSVAFVDCNDVADLQFEGAWLNGSNIPKVYKFDNSAQHVSKDRGVRGSLVTKTANYTITQTDDIVIFNGTSLTATLPSAGATAIGTNRQYVVKNINSTSLTVGSTSGTIDGASTDTLAQYAVGRYLSDGTNWLKL